jgi:pyruvate/2-oxoglutarate dehydrogenase complex dihydrolipoamide dehydrogenase (E3) component
VIIATGSAFRMPDIPGITHGHVLNTVEVYEGRKPVGERVLVVGGGLCGCEAAAYLAQRGKRVTIVEMAQEVVSESSKTINTVLAIQALLAQTGVDVRTRTKLVEVTRTGVLVEHGGTTQELAADTVVIATGFASDLTLRDALEEQVPEVVTVGDCAGAS